MRIGFAGVKHPHANSWADAVAANGGTTPVVYEPDAEIAKAFAAAHGATVVESIGEFATSNVDAVVVDGRCDEVRDMALAAIDLGLPVFIEKPGGMTASDLAEVDSAARGRGLPTQMGYFLRYNQPILDAKASLASGNLGQITLVRCHAGMPDKAWIVMGDWFNDPTNITSIFQEDACHVVDIVQELLGPPQSVVAQRVQGQFEPSVGEDAIAAILNYGTHLACIDFSAREANAWIETWSLEIFGTTGSIRLGLGPGWEERYTPAGWTANDTPRIQAPTDGFAGNFDSSEVYAYGMQAFMNAVATGSATPVDAAKGLSVFRTVEAIAAAADSGARVDLREAVAST